MPAPGSIREGIASGEPPQESAPGRELPGRRSEAGRRRLLQKVDLQVEGLKAVAATPADVKMFLGRRGPDFPVLVEDEVVVAQMLHPVSAVGMSSFILQSIRRRADGRRRASESRTLPTA
jgi:hypothetical protein